LLSTSASSRSLCLYQCSPSFFPSAPRVLLAIPFNCFIAVAAALVPSIHGLTLNFFLALVGTGNFPPTWPSQLFPDSGFLLRRYLFNLSLSQCVLGFSTRLPGRGSKMGRVRHAFPVYPVLIFFWMGSFFCHYEPYYKAIFRLLARNWFSTPTSSLPPPSFFQVFSFSCIPVKSRRKPPFDQQLSL